MTRAELLHADWVRLQNLSGQVPSHRPILSFANPRFAPVFLVRCAHAAHQHGWRRLAKLFSLTNFLLFGLEVPASLQIGPGLVLPHTIGTVLGAARIGANVTIFHQVTLGAKHADFDYDLSKRPVVEDGVTICSGAKVIGPVMLGEGCTIGANAVVLRDVPAGMSAAGVPARLIGEL